MGIRCVLMRTFSVALGVRTGMVIISNRNFLPNSSRDVTSGVGASACVFRANCDMSASSALRTGRFTSDLAAADGLRRSFVGAGGASPAAELGFLALPDDVVASCRTRGRGIAGRAAGACAILRMPGAGGRRAAPRTKR